MSKLLDNQWKTSSLAVEHSNTRGEPASLHTSALPGWCYNTQRLPMAYIDVAPTPKKARLLLPGYKVVTTTL